MVAAMADLSPFVTNHGPGLMTADRHSPPTMTSYRAAGMDPRTWQFIRQAES
jgi:hypothetical protein